MSDKKDEFKEIIRDIMETEVDTINLEYNNSIYLCTISSSSIGCKNGEVIAYVSSPELGKVFSFITDKVTFDQIIENNSLSLPIVELETNINKEIVEEVND